MIAIAGIVGHLQDCGIIESECIGDSADYRLALSRQFAAHTNHAIGERNRVEAVFPNRNRLRERLASAIVDAAAPAGLPHFKFVFRFLVYVRIEMNADKILRNVGDKTYHGGNIYP